MKASDTMMSESEKLGCSLIGELPYRDYKKVIDEACLHQAEISFKAGQEAERERRLHEEFDSQADLIGWLLKGGWIPPEEAKNSEERIPLKDYINRITILEPTCSNE